MLGELVIDEATYAARLRGRLLDLTYKEFELLKYLAQHPGRVFTRAQLLQEVWGYDYFGGTRTVDVHVRRLRAKLGAEHEQMIGTVRNVGYKFVRPTPRGARGPDRCAAGGDRRDRRRRPPRRSSQRPRRCTPASPDPAWPDWVDTRARRGRAVRRPSRTVCASSGDRPVRRRRRRG